jgi:hypothetical protein
VESVVEPYVRLYESRTMERRYADCTLIEGKSLTMQIEKGDRFIFHYVKRYRMKQIILSGETITRPLLQEEEAEADESGQQ